MLEVLDQVVHHIHHAQHIADVLQADPLPKQPGCYILLPPDTTKQNSINTNCGWQRLQSSFNQGEESSNRQKCFSSAVLESPNPPFRPALEQPWHASKLKEMLISLHKFWSCLTRETTMQAIDGVKVFHMVHLEGLHIIVDSARRRKKSILAPSSNDGSRERILLDLITSKPIKIEMGSAMPTY